jgi:hypothetical protein
MKKIAIAAGSALLLASLAACGTNTTPTDTNTVAVAPAPVDTYVPPTPDEQFIYDLRNVGDSNIDGQSDSSLLELGHNICSALDEGNTVTDLINYLVNSGSITGIERTAGTLIAASVTDLCPEYTGQVNDFLTQNS